MKINNMGAYTWLTEAEFEQYSKVKDKDVNEALQEVRALMPEWFVSEKFHAVKRWFKKDKEVVSYTVYKKTSSDEVIYQISVKDKATVLNLLYGLFMGYNKALADWKKRKSFNK